MYETVATLPGGAVVIHEVHAQLLRVLVMNLKQADFTTAQMVATVLADEFNADDVEARTRRRLRCLFRVSHVVVNWCRPLLASVA